MDVERVALDTASFALHLMHMIVCILAFLINLLLFYLLTKYTVFHHHMKMIMINLTLAVLASVFYLLIRSSLGVYQIYHKNPMAPTNEPREDVDCAFSETVPRSICLLFFAFPMCLVIERSIASRRFWDYENENLSGGVGAVCFVLWIPTSIDILGFLMQFSLPDSLETCQYSMLKKTFLQRNIMFIIVAFFCLIFTIMFRLLEKENRNSEADYVANHYTTLSVRFQIRENVKTCRFAVSLNLLLFVAFLVFFLFDQNLSDSDLNEHSAAKREYLFFVFPVFATIYAILFIASHPQLINKTKRTFQNLTSSFTQYHEQEKMLS
ncbi:unnamed protein product [Caenorhabditis bovis]|uniref:G-protein coupled receptors family 1 profile domain-containing protein n=1 Tax=Caenorhabditis bovis TaxID=2654633 RepID=A0A8S1EWM6_9PELO|nr:unnamed protein product [Caenorhabditis bovis]